MPWKMGRKTRRKMRFVKGTRYAPLRDDFDSSPLIRSYYIVIVVGAWPPVGSYLWWGQ